MMYSNSMTRNEAVQSLSTTSGFFRHWMSRSQRDALILAIQGEEGNYFADMLTKLKARIESMPKTYETEGVEAQEKVVHLHYFKGNVDAWIIEKDAGDGSDLLQIQAFGKATLFGDSFNDSEWGYISIAELIANEVELDLHWEIRTIKEIK